MRVLISASNVVERRWDMAVKAKRLLVGGKSASHKGGSRTRNKAWSRAAIAAAKACSVVAVPSARPARAGRRAQSIVRAVRAYYLG
jgi:hypothetical protein